MNGFNIQVKVLRYNFPVSGQATLNNIEIHTSVSDGCSHPREGGVMLMLDGKPGPDGATIECQTNPLDHEFNPDYENGGTSNFDDKNHLGRCYQVRKICFSYCFLIRIMILYINNVMLMVFAI